MNEIENEIARLWRDELNHPQMINDYNLYRQKLIDVDQSMKIPRRVKRPNIEKIMTKIFEN